MVAKCLSKLVGRFARITLALGLPFPLGAHGSVEGTGAALFLDFESADEKVHLVHGTKRTTGKFGGRSNFTTALPKPGSMRLACALGGFHD
jgi:hypothetical protein